MDMLQYVPKSQNGDIMSILICGSKYELTPEQQKIAVDIRTVGATTRDFFGFSLSHLNVTHYTLISEASQDFKDNIIGIDPKVIYDEAAFQDFKKGASNLMQVYITSSEDIYETVRFTATSK